MKNQMFEELIDSVREAGAILRGQKQPSRRLAFGSFPGSIRPDSTEKQPSTERRNRSIGIAWLHMDFENLKIDRSQISAARLEDPDDPPAYWLSQPVEERIEALEMLRHTFYDDPEAGERIQRVLEVTKLDGR